MSLTLDQVREQARQKLKGTCAVYSHCDGGKDKLCQKNENYGRPIGMGGAGLGRSFAANLEALDRVRLHTRVVGEPFEPRLSFDFFGRLLDFPILGASTSGVSAYNPEVSELDFARATVEGCRQAGTLSWRGDTYFYDTDPEKHFALVAIAEAGGAGVPIFKPRAQEVLIPLLQRAAALGCPAVGVDLDGCGSTNFARMGVPVFRKSVKDLKELVAAAGIPFIAKGIMHPDDAQACAEAGAAAVVVSNHGGRVLDSTPGTAEVLPEVARRVGRQVMVLADGGIRNGYDALKMLALGARAVLVGRDLIRAAFGGGAEGVRLQMDQLHKTLRQALLMTGCQDAGTAGSHLLAPAPGGSWNVDRTL